jgi:hypothetical protein
MNLVIRKLRSDAAASDLSGAGKIFIRAARRAPRRVVEGNFSKKIPIQSQTGKTAIYIIQTHWTHPRKKPVVNNMHLDIWLSFLCDPIGETMQINW